MKKLAFILVAIALFAFSFGCSSSSISSSASSNQKVTLRYGIWDKNQLPALQTIADDFHKKNPNITIKIEVTPPADNAYWTKLETAAQGGSLPDLFWMNGPNSIKYESNGILMPIDDLTKSGAIDPKNYPSSLVDLYTYNKTLYGVPKDFDTIALWYNKKLFDDAHVPYPTSSWTWTDLQNAAQKITDKSKGIYGIAAPLYNQEGFYNTIYQNDGYVITPDDKKSGYDQPATIEGLKFWTDLIQKGESPTQAQMTDNTAESLFESGKVAMIYSGSWMSIEYAQNEYTKDKVNLTVLPQGKKRAVMIHGLANVISAKTKYPEQAKKFLAYLGSKDAAMVQAKTGTVIPAFNGTQQTWVDSFKQYNLQSYIDELQYAIPLPHSKNTAKWWDDETTILKKAWSGDIPIDQAAKDMAKQMNQDLAAEK
jgi:multiple sugar transport system substrate-binding protein